jgi:hypothetical protein
MEITALSVDLSYYIGCRGQTFPGNGGGGGGGSSIYQVLVSCSGLEEGITADILGQPAILVAGAGGGTAFYGTNRNSDGTGRSASTSTVDASTGLGGQAPTISEAGGAGAGFSQPGNPADPSLSATGVRQGTPHSNYYHSLASANPSRVRVHSPPITMVTFQGDLRRVAPLLE